MTLLQDPEWGNWSDREIARQCKVDHKTVGKIREELTGEFPSKNEPRTYKSKHGTVAKMNTVKIGKTDPTNGTREQMHLEHLNFESDQYQIAHRDQLVQGGLVEIHVPNNILINGRTGRVATVCDRTVDVWVRDVNTMVMHKHTLKHQLLKPVAMELEPQLVEVCERIKFLRNCNLDPFEIEILLLLERNVAFTPVELEYLTQMQLRHQSLRRDAC